jgi:uncharacterized membrane protein YdjX (TVP38/TMEM64 family)
LARPAEPPAAAGGWAAAAPVAKGLLLLGGLVAAGLTLSALGRPALTSLPSQGGGAALVAAGALLAAAGVPRQAVAFAAGYVFGAWRGGALAMLAQMLGCLMDFWWARAIARDWAARRLRGRLARLDRFLAARPFTATLTLRLLPVGNNLALNLLAGVSGLRAWPFLAATLIGYLPQTVVFSLVGSGVHLRHGVQLALGVGLFAMSAALGAVLVGRRKKAVLF